MRAIAEYLIRFERSLRRHALRTALITVAVIVVGVVTYAHLVGPMQSYAKTEEFIVNPGTSVSQVAAELKSQGYVRSTFLARIALAHDADTKGVHPGGYKIGKQMDLWSIARTLTTMPSLVFVTIPPSVRKEQIGEILADELNWGDKQKAEWAQATSADASVAEGVYYPDTYLIATDQPPTAIAARLRSRFTDVFAPYAKEAEKKGLDWNDVLTMASIIDREAGANDKELVSGILWNRVESGMKLQADATLQYVKGTVGNWWPTPHAADKYLNSPFNTYKHTGLPPHPIDNPSVAAVEAALNPDSTGCLFYLHDANHQIHCSVTYSGQKQNVDIYLR